MPADVAAREAAMPAPAPACSSSSIGKDSDECSPPGKEEEEVQSAYGGGGGRGGDLAGLEALEEALPVRRSISKFYNGKSKSFACLKETASSCGSAKDIAKAESAYSRKRKNLLAYSIMYENSHDTAAEVYETGPPKRPASLSRNSLATLASSSSRSSSCISIEETELPEQLLSPLSPANYENSADCYVPALQLGSCDPKSSSVPMRSFSMMDLHLLHRPRSSFRPKDQRTMD
ncbi:uncharacterized protein LOC102704077 [Oryza brachyantha]|uniref:Uncharacterized protein n=1 Tax=Oryza brachyantha TaxID=4533 RepID=J3MTL1_ORYBR|nr:uncharacterized protein LOC102704077 [Oryza brachyantha]